MSLFLDFPCAVGGSARVKHTAWCQTEPICAVATCDKRVSFYLEEGVCLDECVIQRQCDASAVAWHPKSKLLATGWDDGHVSVWSIAKPAEKREISCCFASDKKHQTQLTLLWNPTGSRLLTCDASGTVVVWKVRKLLSSTRGATSFFIGRFERRTGRASRVPRREQRRLRHHMRRLLFFHGEYSRFFKSLSSSNVIAGLATPERIAKAAHQWQQTAARKAIATTTTAGRHSSHFLCRDAQWKCVHGRRSRAFRSSLVSWSVHRLSLVLRGKK